MSPLGRHVCTTCQAKFSMAHTAKYYLSIISIWLAIGIITFYVADIFNVDILLAYLVYFLIGALVVFPLDRKFDNSWRGTKLRK
ncbi:hypothetical protein GCM10011613_33920 [Cellvibrio zantedeschiae]|uniref:DUF983 domain-containing protein n=2 Tax=Cellvibrio zantedeschiae TaxID=1237077 RepID=A0ABQ3BAH2_9GAMM|nr:hypothetical protein GCM10011613_33920 [Cellvibrio zantedeschiae]